MWFCLNLRAVLELVWVQALELVCPQPLSATRTLTTTMITMPRIMPISMTTIIQMTQMRIMTSSRICNQESSSLQPTVTQIFCELQIEMIFTLDHTSLTLFCPSLHFTFVTLHIRVQVDKVNEGVDEICLSACLFQVLHVMPLVHRICKATYKMGRTCRCHGK